jgi:hypothetical protein
LSDVAAKLLDELNHRIDDPDFRIGPSYFMTSEEQAFSTARLDRTWRSYILPLLQEHYYGRWQQVSHRFELSSLLKAVGASVSVANLGGQDGHDRGIAEGEPKEVTADVDGDQDGPELVDGHDSLGAAPE